MLSALMLTPLSVRPDRQRQGLGVELMRQSLATLEAMGPRIFLVLGHPAYYPRVGFRSELAAELESRWQGKPAFMARCANSLSGRLILPKAILDAH